mmetsp:Transcript_32903/g.75773  ORF Transcript_32903/g.75773 Transcript_32903/m.75773 type:complete len:215 (-) Transcript_32903:567-1211(-)
MDRNDGFFQPVRPSQQINRRKTNTKNNLHVQRVPVYFVVKSLWTAFGGVSFVRVSSRFFAPTSRSTGASVASCGRSCNCDSAIDDDEGPSFGSVGADESSTLADLLSSLANGTSRGWPPFSRSAASSASETVSLLVNGGSLGHPSAFACGLLQSESFSGAFLAVSCGEGAAGSVSSNVVSLGLPCPSESHKASKMEISLVDVVVCGKLSSFLSI